MYVRPYWNGLLLMEDVLRLALAAPKDRSVRVCADSLLDSGTVMEVVTLSLGSGLLVGSGV